MKSSKCDRIFLQVQEIHAIELGKVPKRDVRTGLLAWLDFLNEKDWSDLTMVIENNEVVTEEQKEVVAHDAKQELLDTEEKLRDAEQRMLEAKQRLHATEQKLNEMKQKTRESIAKNLSTTGMSNKDISKATGLPAEELTKIFKILNK